MEDSNNSTNIENPSRKVELAFPKYEEADDEYISKRGVSDEGVVKHLSTSMDAIGDWFKQYQVESIELWISGMMETGGITKLVLSAKGEGGMRVILKPKPTAAGLTDLASTHI
jgi:hypothetical protein